MKRAEEQGENYTLSSCVQFLTNKCSTHSAMKSLNDKVDGMSKGKGKGKRKEQEKFSEKEKSNPKPTGGGAKVDAEKRKEVASYLAEKKLDNICFKCKRGALEGRIKVGELKEYKVQRVHEAQLKAKRGSDRSEAITGIE